MRLMTVSSGGICYEHCVIYIAVTGMLACSTVYNCAAVYKDNALKSKAHRGADKSLARPGRKQATATEDFDVHISYL